MKSVEIGLVPFHIGLRATPSNAPFPDELPFAAGLNAELGILSQRPDVRIAEMLKSAYASGSQLNTPMDDYGIGKETCEDFIRFILSVLERRDLNGVRLLEIGCGTGYLLARLKELGAKVLGVEPGTASSIHAENAGITVIHEPFEVAKVDGTFDLIVHTGVLEHVPDPLGFLQRQLSMLNKGGRIALAVPDCDAPIEHGDLSMFVHEHWSYLTQSSLATLIDAVGGRAISIRKAGIGGALYAMMEGTAIGRTKRNEGGSVQFNSFAERASRGKDALAEFFAARQSRSIGIYCPARFLNYWRHVGCPRPRFFDDDPRFHDRYYPPIPVAVESRGSLLEKPVDSLLIMSRTFGPALAESLGSDPRLARREIVTIAELF